MTAPIKLPPIISQADARARGLKRYFTGKPCKRGHLAERRVSGGKCVGCEPIEREWRDKTAIRYESLSNYKSLRIQRNKFGFRGIWFDQKDNIFRARIGSNPYENLGSFLTAEEAAKAYDEAARKRYGSDAYLNFPRAAERRVLPAQTLEQGFCKNGHPLKKFGHVTKRHVWQTIQCRACNADAVKKLRKRRQA